MSIHKEGRSLLFYLLIILFLINAGAQYAESSELVMNILLGGSLILYILVLQFFRNPKIIVNQNEKLIYAPADGKVVVIEKTVENEFFHVHLYVTIKCACQ